MAEVVWREKALDDLDDIVAYIREFDPQAAVRVRQRLIDCGDSLEHFPRRGRPARQGRREMTTAPPYVLTYRVEQDAVFILNIRHGAQLPRD